MVAGPSAGSSVVVAGSGGSASWSVVSLSVAGAASGSGAGSGCVSAAGAGGAAPAALLLVPHLGVGVLGALISLQVGSLAVNLEGRSYWFLAASP